MSTPIYGVFAATGKQGHATATALLKRGAAVRALVRRPDSEAALALKSQGAEVVYANADEPQSLAPALAGLAGVWFMTTMTPELGAAAELPMGRAIVDTAVEAGVPHIVFSSVGGAERSTGIGHFDSKYEVEKYIHASGVDATIVRPVFFMENLQYMTAVEGGTATLRLPLPDGIPLQMTSVHDIGEVAATALIEPSRVSGGAVEIAGDELTGTEIAEAIGAALNVPGVYQALPIEVMAEQPDAQAMFAWFAKLPAYQADFAATDELAGGALNLAAWLKTVDWTTGA